MAHVPEEVVIVPQEFKGSFVEIPNGELQGEAFSPDALELVEDSLLLILFGVRF